MLSIVPKRESGDAEWGEIWLGKEGSDRGRVETRCGDGEGGGVEGSDVEGSDVAEGGGAVEDGDTNGGGELDVTGRVELQLQLYKNMHCSWSRRGLDHFLDLF